MNRRICLSALLTAAVLTGTLKAEAPAPAAPAGAPVNLSYRLTSRGKPFGTEEVTLRTSESGRALSGVSRLTLPNDATGTLTQELATKLDGTPVSYRLDVDVPGQQLTITAAAAGTGYTLAILPKGGTEPLKTQQVEAKAPVVLLDNTIASHFDLLTRLLTDLPLDQERAYTMLVPQVLQAIPGTIKRTADGTANLDGKSIGVRNYRMTVANLVLNVQASARDGAMLQVEVPIQELVIARTGYAAAVAPSAAAPSDPRELATHVTGPAGDLPATLLVPKAAAPLPAVLLLSGSGPHDRDETIGPNKPFLDIALGLGDRGIASLRVDKRTYALRDKAKATLAAEYYEDAAAALRVLASTPGIDPKRIFVLGHSEGAMVAPTVARTAPTVRGVVLLAAPARPIDALMIEQTEFGGKLMGQSADDLAEQTQALEKEFAIVKDPKSPDGPSVLGVPRSYWREVLALDPATAIKDSSRPFLVLQGEKDFQVSKSRDFDALKSAVGEDGGRVSYASFPDLNHLFMKVEGQSSGAEYGLPGKVDRAVISRIAEWILAH